MTKGECRALFLRVLDEATANGVMTTDTQRADYRDKFDYFLNGALLYLAGHLKTVKEHAIAHTPLKNNYPSGRALQICSPGTKVLEAVGRACYFEVCGSVFIRVCRNGAEVYRATNTGGFNPYRYFVSSTKGLIQIELSSEFAFSVRNAAVYENAFSARSEDVPAFGRYQSYPLPGDLREIKAVVREDTAGNLSEATRYIRQSSGVIALPTDEPGAYVLRYYANPAPVPAEAPDSTVLELPAKAGPLLALKVAYDATLSENPGLSSWLKGVFDNELGNTLAGEVEGPRSVIAVYSMN